MKTREKTIKDNRGVALLWALLFAMVLLVMGSSMALLAIKELRITANIDESNRAYLAAEAGLERGLYDVKKKFDENLSWCGNLNTGNVSIGTNLSYSVNISCPTGNYINIESTGVDQGRTQRKIKTQISFVDPGGKIETYDNPPPGWSNGYYNFPTDGTERAPFIIQQFDITRSGLFNYFTNQHMIGMGTGMPGTNYLYLEFKRGSSTTTLDVDIKSSHPSIVLQKFSFGLSANTPYRVKIEYVRQSPSYIIARATVLKREVSDAGKETFVCLGDDKPYTVYAIIDSPGFGFNPSKVRAKGGSDSQWRESGGNGYLLLDNRLRVDNMVFWGKE